MLEFGPDIPHGTDVTDRTVRRRRPWLRRGGAALVTLATVAVAIVAAVVLMGRPDTEVPRSATLPSVSPLQSTLPTSEAPEPSRSSTASPGTSEIAVPTGLATPDLSWSEAGAFEAVGPAFVNDIVVADGRLLAVGVAYDGALPNLGPSPAHQGRIWESSDGRAWTDVTPEGPFANANLGQAIVLPDRTVVVVGAQAEVSDSGALDASVPRAWESSDGRTWQDSDSGLAGAWRVTSIVSGARGYLAQVELDVYYKGVSELWFSADGRSWEPVRQFTDGYVSIDAGDEGFVAVGEIGASSTQMEPFAIASADGREWHESTMPPSGSGSVVARGPDWQAFTRDSVLGLDDPVDVSVSENGLDWTRSGSVEPAVVDLGDGARCVEWPFAVLGAGPWLIQSSTLSYPCGEGGFFTNGTPRISVDGLTWQSLPFAPGTPGMAEAGSRVTAAVVFDGRLVLGGNSNGLATFWIGESP